MIVYQEIKLTGVAHRRRKLSGSAIAAALLYGIGPGATFAQTPADVPAITAVGTAAPNPQIQVNPAPPAPLTSTAPITLPSYREPGGPELSIEQAVSEALNSNTQVQIARETLKRVKYQVQQVEGEALPQLSFSASDTYSRRDTSPGGVSQANTSVSTGGVGIPTITDDQSGTSASSGSSTAATASTTTTTSSGAGSSTTSSTVTLVPVTGPAGSSSTGSTSDVQVEGGSKADTGSTTTTATTQTSPILATFTAAPYRLNNYGGEINLSQVIDVDGLVSTSEKLLDNEAAFYKIDLTRQENEIAYSVKAQYFAVLRAERQFQTDQEQVTNYQAELNDAQNRYNAGTSPAFDVISAQTELSNAQQTLIDAEINLDIQRATLNNLLNRPVDTPFTTNTPAQPVLPTDSTDSSAVAVAFANRPELLEANLAIQIAKKIERLDHAGQLPQMALTAALVYSGYASFPNGLGTSGSVTAAVTLPLFDGGQTRALVNEAKANVQIEQQTSDSLHNSVSLEVRSAFVNVRDGASLVAANTQGVAEARESLRLANIRYKAGTGTLLEVTNAEADLATAETNLSTAQFQLQTEYASLLRSEGLR